MFGRYWNHAEIRSRRAGARREPDRQRGQRLRPRPAAARARSHPPRHALAGPVPPRLRHAVRARRLAPGPRRAAGREADGPELDRRLHGRDARGAPHDAARCVEDGQGRRAPIPRRDRHDQVLRRPGPLQRDRPGASRCTVARLLDGPPARVDVPPRSGGAHLRRPRRGPPPSPWPARCCKNYEPVEVPTEHMPTRAAAARERFSELLELFDLEQG